MPLLHPVDDDLEVPSRYAARALPLLDNPADPVGGVRVAQDVVEPVGGAGLVLATMQTKSSLRVHFHLHSLRLGIVGCGCGCDGILQRHSICLGGCVATALGLYVQWLSCCSRVSLCFRPPWSPTEEPKLKLRSGPRTYLSPTSCRRVVVNLLSICYQVSASLLRDCFVALGCIVLHCVRCVCIACASANDLFEV